VPRDNIAQTTRPSPFTQDGSVREAQLLYTLPPTGTSSSVDLEFDLPGGLMGTSPSPI